MKSSVIVRLGYEGDDNGIEVVVKVLESLELVIDID